MSRVRYCRVCGEKLTKDNKRTGKNRRKAGNICKACDCERRRQKYHETKTVVYHPYNDPDWLFDRHHEDGLLLSQMADLAGCHRATIRNKMQEFGIEILRPSGERHHRYKKPVTDLTVDIRYRMSVAKRGDRNPHWCGGISYDPYCPKFNEKLKEEIREQFGRLCVLCGEPENGRRLSVHHVDYNKNTLCNGKMWGLVPLCGRCHSRTNGNRWYWFNLLGNYYALDDRIQFVYPDFFVGGI